MKNIAISTTTFGQYDLAPLELLSKQGFSVNLNPYRRKVTPDELVDLAHDSIGLIAGTERITKEVLAKLHNLKVISRCGAGVDNLDLQAAKAQGIEVFNTPDAPTLAVSELTVGLIFNLLRKVSRMDRDIRNGKWKKQMGNLVYAKRMGIIGFGRIGRTSAQILKNLSCEVAYHDPFVEDGLLELKSLPKQELLRWSDIILIHVSKSQEIIGENELASMKKGSWLINISRGEAVNEAALLQHLENGNLAGAAIDVFKKEPYNGPLKDLDNVILTPHIGSYAVEARIHMEAESVNNLLKGLSREVKK